MCLKNVGVNGLKVIERVIGWTLYVPCNDQLGGMYCIRIGELLRSTKRVSELYFFRDV